MNNKQSTILLINPPIYDFSAFDFWLKPSGLLAVAGFLAGRAELPLFDYLDRPTTKIPPSVKLRSDQWCRGDFLSEIIEKPKPLASIPRRYKRFGKPRHEFQSWLASQTPFDAALIQTSMTYWYPGVREVIEDVRSCCPDARIVLGGVYASLCPDHARSLGPDLVIEGQNLAPLWQLLNVTPDLAALPLWNAYPHLDTGILKLADGCPFRCSYCSVPRLYPHFAPRPLARIAAELDLLLACGARNIAFYDDALLHDAEHILLPFLRRVLDRRITVNFHTPNALHVRFITPDLAATMVAAGFKTFYLGFESAAADWHAATGSKTFPDDFPKAVKNLLAAGADRHNITAYIIAAHPNMAQQQIEDSMRMAADLGIRIMLAEFSPIPDTPDGDKCAALVDLSEPLWHNKTAWPLRFLGPDKVNALKDLCHRLNQSL